MEAPALINEHHAEQVATSMTTYAQEPLEQEVTRCELFVDLSQHNPPSTRQLSGISTQQETLRWLLVSAVTLLLSEADAHLPKPCALLVLSLLSMTMANSGSEYQCIEMQGFPDEVFNGQWPPVSCARDVGGELSYTLNGWEMYHSADYNCWLIGNLGQHMPDYDYWAYTYDPIITEGVWAWNVYIGDQWSGVDVAVTQCGGM